MDNRYFERTDMLLGRGAAEKMKSSNVIVFGLGGVGGHLVEGLVRSGLGRITIVDADVVSETNINRQLIATVRTIGMDKVDAMEERIHGINPDCAVTKIKKFVLPDNIGDFDFAAFDYAADAIDTVSAKIAIAKACSETGTPAISAMGAGNKFDPTKFEVADIYKTSVCPLAAAMRRELRKAGVPALKVVYSRETAVSPAFQPENEGETRRITPASCSFVPSVCGLIMAGEIIKDICGKNGRSDG